MNSITPADMMKLQTDNFDVSAENGAAYPSREYQ